MTRSEARLPQEISMECLKWPEDVKNHHRWQNFLVSFNDKLFYSYMNRVLRKGAILHRQRETKNEFTNNGNTVKHMVEELSRDDLYTSPEYMASDHLRSEFKRLREEEKRNAKNSPRVAFLRVLWGLVKPTFIPAGLFQLIYILTQCAVPLVVKVLLTKLEEHPGENFTKTGLPIAFVLFLLSILEGISSERQKFLSFQSGIICKTAIINSAYDHILSLTPAGKAGLTSGETTNLVAIDAQKLFELTQDGHQIWSCPLAMIIVTVLLLLELGPSILVGMASMFLMVPLVQRIVLYMMAIRKKRVAQSDRRVEATSSMLQGIKFTKLNHYEDKFLRRVTEAREAEMKLLGKELAVFGVTMFLTVTSPVIGVALTLGTYVLLDDGNVLTASTTFTTLFLFAALRFPINYAGKLMGKAAQGLSACQRFADFFERETNPDSTSQRKIDDDNIHNDDTVLKVVDGNFFVGSGEMSEDTNPDISNRSKALFTLSDINISVKRSEVLCVVGPVGCGKSTLCQGLIGDVPSKSTGIAIKGKVAYASQTPFILNSTFRENILFGNEYDKTKYDKVLEACCLMPDLDQIGPARDLTEIGERGVTLSGGQKQRVSLARAAYCQPDVAIFDDPLSALDAATGKAVFEKLIKSENSVLSRSAIVLVTHASHFLNRVDKILVLVDGRPEFLGNWDSLLTFQPSNSVTLEAISSIRSAVQEDHSEDEVLPSNESSTNVQKLSDRGGDAVGDLMTTEEREFGLTDWRTWFKWFKYAGGIHFVAVAVLTLGLDRFFYVATEWWIASWTAAQTEPINRLGREYPPQSEGRKAQYEYLATFGIILLISFVFTMSRTQWLIQAGGRCSNKLFTLMTKRVMRAPMWYFETTPLGRILNRFTHDMEELDITLTQTMTTVMTSVGWFVTGFALQTAILPWQSLALSFIMVIYWLLLLHYRKSAIDLQRLDAVSRSPIQAQLAEVLDGAPIIRVHDQVDYFARIFRSALDNNSSAMMNFLAANRWLSVRIQMVGSFAVLASVAAVVTFNEVLMLPTGIAALLIIWSSKFTISLGFMVQAISESEAALTSVERVDDMTRVPQEKDAITDSSSVTLASDWPSSGSLVFNDVSLRYRPGLPLSLDGLSFSLQTGQRCGIVGRTGAGKSTLSVALFRLVEIENGTITLDGVDLSKLGLADVRGRKNGMCIIPQDPVLFSGSLRECLDPFNDSTDDEVLDALRAIRLVNVSERGIDVLKDRVEEGGSNYSVGERQLLCLARAILAKPRLLVLDEATASVDGETDAFIQRMLRTRFQGATLLTIAHRLNTIMDYDVILAIENGKAAEFGSPQELLERRGLFSSLVDSTGKQSSAALRRISLASDEY